MKGRNFKKTNQQNPQFPEKCYVKLQRQNIFSKKFNLSKDLFGIAKATHTRGRTEGWVSDAGGCGGCCIVMNSICGGFIGWLGFTNWGSGGGGGGGWSSFASCCCSMLDAPPLKPVKSSCLTSFLAGKSTPAAEGATGCRGGGGGFFGGKSRPSLCSI